MGGADNERAASSAYALHFLWWNGRNSLIEVERRGMIVFAHHPAKFSEETGLRLRPAEFFAFGYPEAEAPLQSHSASISQRVLVWEDEHRDVPLSTNDPVGLGRRCDANAGLKRSVRRLPVMPPRLPLPKKMLREHDITARAPILLA